jgi:hypothetical protein
MDSSERIVGKQDTIGNPRILSRWRVIRRHRRGWHCKSVLKVVLGRGGSGLLPGLVYFFEASAQRYRIALVNVAKALRTAEFIVD